MAVKRTPPSHQFPGDFVDLATFALARLAECGRAADHEPAQRDLEDAAVSGRWVDWHDQLHVQRVGLERAVAALLAHPEYETAHRRQWNDAITVRSEATVAWAPVARRVLRDMATARAMSQVE